MDFELKTITLQHAEMQGNAMMFIPTGEMAQFRAVFTHGYTSSKHSILNWGSRLAESGIPTIIFDLPGHYLGSYNDVIDAASFKANAPGFFKEAYKQLLQIKLDLQTPHRLIVGGHSLGALLSLKALEGKDLPDDTLTICAGFGLGPEDEVHAFDSEFYKKAFAFREQLVSPSLRGDFILPWIKEQKTSLQISGKTIHLITGKDDVVVAKDGSERLMELLHQLGNDVTLTRPNKMSHHMPELAGPHVMAFIRSLK